MVMYRLYDAPDWPDVPFEHDGRGIFLKSVAESDISSDPQFRILELNYRGFIWQKCVPRIRVASDAREYRKLVMRAYTGPLIGVFVDVRKSLEAAQFTPEPDLRDALNTAELLDCPLSNAASHELLAELLRELKPVAIFGGDLDWVLMLETA